MGEGTHNPVIYVLAMLVLASIVLLVIGFWLRDRGVLRAPAAAMFWAILTVMPVFGAGFAIFTRHQADRIAHVTPAGINQPDRQGRKG